MFGAGGDMVWIDPDNEAVGRCALARRGAFGRLRAPRGAGAQELIADRLEADVPSSWLAQSGLTLRLSYARVATRRLAHVPAEGSAKGAC